MNYLSSNPILVEKHVILSDSEADEVLKKFKITPDKLPKIYDDDPQILKVKGKPGQIVAIDRDDDGKKYTYYRLIIKKGSI